MNRENNKEEKSPTLRELYPTLTDEQLKIAEKNLDRFIMLMWRIAQRLAKDPVALAEYKRLCAESEEKKDDESSSLLGA